MGDFKSLCPEKEVGKYKIYVMSAGCTSGWTDPLLQQNVSLGFAWPANDTASSVLSKSTVDLTWRDSPLIFQYSLSTGASRYKQPYWVNYFTCDCSVCWAFHKFSPF